MSVHFDDGPSAVGRDGFEISGQVFVGRIGNGAGQDVGLKDEVFSVERLQRHLFAGHSLAGLDIIVHLIVQTTLQFAAHTSQFLRIERDILQPGSVGIHRNEVLVPGGAAEFASAGASSADASGLLSSTDLLHFDAHVKGFGQHLDKLTKVYTLVGDVIEDSFIAIALVFYVADLHFQSEIFGDLSTLNHRIVFPTLGFGILIHISRLG